MSALALVKVAFRTRYLSLALLTPYVNLSLRLLLAFALGGVVVDTLARNAQPAPNPFVNYLDIFPGQSMSAVEERGFSCQFAQNHNYYTTPAEEHCELIPPEDIFSAIEVVASGQSVREIKFSLNQNSLQLGDLLVTFGIPKFQSYPQTTFAFWRDYFVTLPTGQNAHINPTHDHVWSVAFALADQ